MKRTFLGATIGVMMATVPAFALEPVTGDMTQPDTEMAATEMAVEEQTVEEQAAGTQTITGTGSILGRWYGVAFEGNNDYRISGEVYILPNHQLYFPENGEFVPFADTDTEGRYEVEIPEEAADSVSSIIMEIGTLETPVDTIATFVLNDPGCDMVTLTVSATPADNPLAASEEESVSTLLRYQHEETFLGALMMGRVWNIDDNVLVIDADGNMDLNDGKATGRATFNFDLDRGYPMLAVFRWDGGSANIVYEPTEITGTSITLENIDDPSDVMVLTYAEDLAAEAETE